MTALYAELLPKELISANYSIEQICRLLNADSLYFISLEGLKKSIGIESCCMACFNQFYPTNLYLKEAKGEKNE